MRHFVGCLSDEASQQVLLAGDVQLNVAQLKVALNFCGGLPLALTLLNGALRAEDDPADLIEHLETHGTFSADAEDELVAALAFSVECLSEELQTAWLDLAWMYTRLQFFWELTCLFGEHTLKKLQDRNLITFRLDTFPRDEFTHVEVVLHDVLLRMAERMYGQPGKYCLKRYTRAFSLSQAMKVRICRCVAASCHMWQQNGFAVERLNQSILRFMVTMHAPCRVGLLWLSPGRRYRLCCIACLYVSLLPLIGAVTIRTWQFPAVNLVGILLSPMLTPGGMRGPDGPLRQVHHPQPAAP
jgi:hypothetical protein